MRSPYSCPQALQVICFFLNARQNSRIIPIYPKYILTTSENMCQNQNAVLTFSLINMVQWNKIPVPLQRKGVSSWFFFADEPLDRYVFDRTCSTARTPQMVSPESGRNLARWVANLTISGSNQSNQHGKCAQMPKTQNNISRIILWCNSIQSIFQYVYTTAISELISANSPQSLIFSPWRPRGIQDDQKPSLHLHMCLVASFFVKLYRSTLIFTSLASSCFCWPQI